MAIAAVIIVTGLAIWADLKWGPDSYEWKDIMPNKKRRN